MMQLEKLNQKQLFQKLSNKYDLFICCSSFDKRCLTIAQAVKDVEFNRIDVFHFEKNYPAANDILESLKSLFDNGKGTLYVQELKKNDPLGSFDIFHSIFNKTGPFEAKSVLVDITAFTKENLLILLKLLSFYKGELDVTFCYTPSQKYPHWLSKGVKEIRSVLGFPGKLSPIKKMLLIVLTGFEYERAQIVIDNYEPDKLFLGVASSQESFSFHLAEINKKNFESLSMIYPDAEEVNFSCIDINKTKEVILATANKYIKDYNIIVVPMNNKLSTLGVAFAALENTEIQICYASTNQYNIEEFENKFDTFNFIKLNEFF